MKYFYMDGKVRKEYVLAENETIQESGDHYLVLVDTGLETHHKDLRIEGEEEPEEKPEEEKKPKAKPKAEKPKEEAKEEKKEDK